jgi:hypothetical protein
VSPSDSTANSGGIPIPPEFAPLSTPSYDATHAAPDAPAPEPAEAGYSPDVPAFAGLDLTTATALAEPAEEFAAKPSALHRARMRFRHWRRTRPFWGGLLILLGGGEILFSEKAPLKLVLHIGLQGLAGYLLPAVMVLCGALLWFAPAQRTFYSILSVMLSLGTWLTSNLGGFIIGMLLGLIGGSLAFGWTPRRQQPAAEAPPVKTAPAAGPPTQATQT